MKSVQNKWMKHTTKIGACLVGLLFTLSAAADSTTTYTGYECWFAGSTGTMSGFEEGALISSTYTRCPLLRIDSSDTTNISYITIRVKDDSSTAGISCTAYSCAGMGDPCGASSTASTGNSYKGSTYLSLGSMIAYSTGYAYIYCDIPSNGNNLIYSYRATD